MHRARSKYGIEQGDRVRHFIPADLVDAELSDRKDRIERALKSFFLAGHAWHDVNCM